MTPILLHKHSQPKPEDPFSSDFVNSWRNQILEFGERVDLVSGEVDGKIFVLEAAQAKELIENAIDAENLIAGLKP